MRKAFSSYDVYLEQPDIVVEDTYFETYVTPNENIEEFEQLFQFKEQLCALLLNKPSLSKSVSASDFRQLAKSSSDADLSSYSSQNDDVLSEKEPTRGVKGLLSSVREKLRTSDKDAMATNLLARTNEKHAQSRVEHLNDFYEKLTLGLRKQIQRAQTDSQKFVLFRQARNQIYRYYLVELYGEVSHQVCEFDTYAFVYRETDKKIELISNDRLRTPTPQFASQTPLEYSENTPIIGSVYSENDEEMLTKGGMEMQEVRVKRTILQRIVQLLSLVFPIFLWAPEYFKSGLLNNIKRDVLAGVTIAIILCPQGIAYALVAGMPPIYAFIPPIIYSFLGTSRVVAVGPSVIVSLILYQAVNTDIQPRNPLEYVSYVLLISMIGGGIQFLCGIFRLGFLVNFLSKPILSGFTTGAAILIGMTQVKYLFGIKPESEVNPQIYWTFYYLGKAIFTPSYSGADQGVHWPTMLTAGLCFFFLILFKFIPIPWRGGKWYHIDDFFPSNLIVIIGGTILMTLISLSPAAQFNSSSHDVFGIQILGHLDMGLPKPGLPKFYENYILSNDTPLNGTVAPVWIPVGDPIITWDIIARCVIVAIPCLLIGFAEEYSVASFYAVKDNYTVDPNQELMGIGLGAFVGSFFSAYTASTSMSRSALSAAAGARSQFAGLLTGLLMIVMLLIVAQAFYYLPKALLGAMIIMAILKLIDLKMVKYTYQTKTKDFVAWLACFLMTLFVGLQWGILLATLLSLGFVIYRASRPRLVILGKEPGSTNYQSIVRFPRSIRTPGVLVLRVDSEIFFGNCSYVVSSVRKMIEKTANQFIVNENMKMTNKCRALVMDMGSVNQIDSTGVLCLFDIKKFLDFEHVTWYLANVKPEVIREMQQGKFIAEGMFDESYVYATVHDAVRHAVDEIKKK